LSRSILPLAKDCRAFLNKSLSVLPEGCRNGMYYHLAHDQNFKDGFFELIVGRTLQEMGADIECEPENPIDRTRVDFVAEFPDETVYVEAVSPVLDRELGEIYSREVPLTNIRSAHALLEGIDRGLMAPRTATDGYPLAQRPIIRLKLPTYPLQAGGTFEFLGNVPLHLPASW
jgi:hypothetical protein